VQQVLMKDEEAVLCDAVMTSSEKRPDILRLFHLPEFADLKRLFLLRFPDAAQKRACEFARALSDELGCTTFSFLQVSRTQIYAHTQSHTHSLPPSVHSTPPSPYALAHIRTRAHTHSRTHIHKRR